MGWGPLLIGASNWVKLNFLIRWPTRLALACGLGLGEFVMDDMANYFVYWNCVTKDIRIHRSSCPACKDGDGIHEVADSPDRGTKYDWEPAETYTEAEAIAATIEQQEGFARRNTLINCRHCCPQEN